MLNKIKHIIFVILILFAVITINPNSIYAFDYLDLINSTYFDTGFDASGYPKIPQNLINNNYLNYGGKRYSDRYSESKQDATQEKMGIPSNDYSYVTSRAQVWCLNDVSNRSGETIYIQDILTLKGGTAYSNRYSSRKKFTQDPYNVAKFAYEMAFMKDTAKANWGRKGVLWTEFITNCKFSNGTKFYDNGSAVWTIFYPTYVAGSTKFYNSHTATINGKNMNLSTYATAIKDLSNTSNFSCSDSSKIAKYQKKDSQNNYWEYKLSGVKLEWNWDDSGKNLISNRKIKIDGTEYSVIHGELSTGNSGWFVFQGTSFDKNKVVGKVCRTDNDADSYIYFNKTVGDKIVSKKNVKFIEEYSEIWARIYLLGADTRQSRGVADGKIINSSRDIETNVTVVQKDPDVSIQKYVTDVRPSNATKPWTEISNYEGTSKYGGSEGHSRNNKIAGSKESTLAISKWHTATNWKKDANPVIIDPGAYVTYRVIVYNNGQNENLQVTLKDMITKNATLYSIFQEESEKISATETKYTYKKVYGRSTINDTVEISENEDGDCYIYEYNFKTSDNYEVFLFSFKMQDTLRSSAIANKAWIAVTDNQKNYRVKDYDYVKMPEYKVSLQKYITEAGDSQYTNRNNKPIYSNNATTKVYKSNNPVKVAKGDTVKYTIVLKNDGVKKTSINSVTDVLPTGLRYLRSSLPTSAITVSGQTIKINTQRLMGTEGLAAGGTVSFDIYAEVTETASGKLENTAKITDDKIRIGNITGTEITDSTTNDNIDKDYIEVEETVVLEEKNVSVQKYLHKIVKSNGALAYGPSDERSGWYTYEGDNTSRINKPVTATIGNSTKFKRDDQKIITEGARATYKIVVYNNTNVEQTNIKVTEHAANEEQVKIIKISKNAESAADIFSSWTKVDTTKYEYTIDRLAPNSSITFFVVLEYSNVSVGSGTIKNYAFIDVENDTYRTYDREFVKYEGTPEVDSDTDVSLQKYIIGVQQDSPDTNKGSTNLENERKNVYARNSYFALRGCLNHSGKDISTNEVVDTSKPYKMDNPYIVEVGNNVTYQILIYNNDSKAVKAKITDCVLNYSEIKLQEVRLGEEGNYEEAAVISGANFVDGGDGHKYLSVVVDLEPHETKALYVTLQFNVLFAGVTENKACVESVTDTSGNTLTNDTEYRNVDADYIQTIRKVEYKISIDKSVRVVTDSTNTYSKNYSRSEKQLYAENVGGTFIPDNNPATNNTYKSENPVGVEPGDYVEYAIKVKNDGDEPAYIASIKDKVDSRLTDVEAWSSITGVNVRYDANADEEIIINEGDGKLVTAGGTFTIYLKAKVSTEERTIIENTAAIGTLKNSSGDTIIDSTQNDNTDSDYIDTGAAEYNVELEKYIAQVNGVNVEDTRAGKPEYDGHRDKFDNPVTVKNGDIVSYYIRVKNIGETIVKFDTIVDTLPQGVEYLNCSVASSYDSTSRKVTINLNRTLNPNYEAIIILNVKVTESNISVEILRNIAELTKISNRNGYEVTDNVTPNNHIDSDYIQLQDISISGKVWNDKLLTKDGVYNGLYDSEENALKDIPVYLYRIENTGIGVSEEVLVGETKTDDNGEYIFNRDNLNHVSIDEEKYIKGPKASGSNKWAGNYYSYYVVFEYDGVTYTSTKFAEVTSTNNLDSNADENIGKVKENRTDFNNKFEKINNESGIAYTTKNEPNYIPESNYVYNPATMAIQSSTKLIDLQDLANNNTSEVVLTHINLGLRGRDILDFQITSNVASVEVTVNGVSQEYQTPRKVSINESDLPGVVSDAANYGPSERDLSYTEEKTQLIRKTDFKGVTGSRYSETGLKVKVNYSITVKNTSQTEGKVYKIVEYYSKLLGDPTNITGATFEAGTGIGSGAQYNTKLINLNQKLNPNEEKEISVTFELPATTLNSIRDSIGEIKAYNMFEIYEYGNTSSNEKEKGLIDKDSAPGSANTELVRLSPSGTGSISTAAYYFAGNNLSSLKYEDDTDTAPVIFFRNTTEPRTLRGIVFVDNDKNGRLDSGEKKVEGAKVELIETVGTGAAAVSGTPTVTYSTTSDTNGEFTITGFLPGEHALKYYYGDNQATLIVSDSTKPAGKDSYNGYLYESTTPVYSVAGEAWKNNSDKKSIAADDAGRRSTVNAYTSTLDNINTTILNSFYTKAWGSTEITTLKDKTNMYANSDTMKFGVEYEDGRDSGSAYEVINMNFGIKERPVSTLTLEKRITEINLVDSTGRNTLASAKYDYSNPSAVQVDITGDVLSPDGEYADISLSDDKLQGASLTIKYDIIARQNSGGEKVKITGFVDYIPNSLTFNPELDNNKDFWEVVSDKSTLKLTDSTWATNITPKKDEANTHNVIVQAKGSNTLLGYGNELTQSITLETKLSSTDSTIEQIITSAEELIYEYTNKVEVLTTKATIGGTDSSAGNVVLKTAAPDGDTVLTTLGGNTRDTVIYGGSKNIDPTVPIETTSQTTAIHPPTGFEGLTTTHYIIISSSLVIIGIGIVLIKKYVLKK